MGILGCKLLLALGIFLANGLGGFLTITAMRCMSRAKTVNTYAQSFTAGIFLGIVFLMLNPELPIEEADFNEKYNSKCHTSITSISAVFGIIFMLLIDSTIKAIREKKKRLEDVEMSELPLATSASSLTVISPPPENLYKFVLFATLMSVHSLFEGLPIGYKDTKEDILSYGLPMLLHKFLEAMTVASAGYKEKKVHAILGCTIHSLMTPIGSLIGLLLTGEHNNFMVDVALLVVMGMSVGTIVYITFMEILAPLMENPEFKGVGEFKKIGAILGGFLVTGAISAVIGTLESHQATSGTAI
ncbi:hypothetical protein B9Z55_025369 [Caenorhabditis nigoni]|uniref:Zinc/iron permease n=1 Tax=Caenorhabditis nigoni TaxID=1611254 RepID=A0A2G5SYC3_9PELO|nr:hypothetical protein B9Z55_025369 [Caenorhabditis nigoni]